jgi:hypothetical protein
MQADYSEGLRAATGQQVRREERAKASDEKPLMIGKHEEYIKVLRSLQQESSQDLPRLNHPCLQSGYSKPYRRLIYETVPSPARVQLIGK